MYPPVYANVVETIVLDDMMMFNTTTTTTYYVWLRVEEKCGKAFELEQFFSSFTRFNSL